MGAGWRLLDGALVFPASEVSIFVGLARRAGNRRHDDRQDDEQSAENGRRAGQEIGRAARRHEARRASADAKAAAFGALHQDHADERDGDERLDDQQEGEHVWTFLGNLVAAT